ncbi:MAG: NADH-quinone oxidoreductase subunit H [Bradymonadaceae bacterium]
MPNWISIPLFLLTVLAAATVGLWGFVTLGAFLPPLPGWTIALMKIGVIVFGFAMGLSSLMTVFGDRKQSAKIQNRMGPNRATFFGMSLGGFPHFIADGIKMLLKEYTVPDGANKVLHTISPILALAPVLLGWAVIPFMDQYCTGQAVVISEYPYSKCVNGEYRNYFQIMDLNAGVLFAFAIASIEVYAAAIAGWASNNKYSLLGGMRSAAQMISYEVSLGLSIAGILMLFGTLNLNEIALMQGKLLFGWIPMWGIVLQPLAFFIFFLAGMAETKRPPFDQPEGEEEIIAGFYTEYSTMSFAVFELSGYVATVFLAALTALLFLGGWQVPFLYDGGFYFGGIGDAAAFHISLPYSLVVAMRIVAMCFKIIALVWLQFMMRWSLPRFRYDQVMVLGWKILLPLSLANLFVTALVVMLI